MNKSKLSFHDALKISYEDKKMSKKDMMKKGYYLDNKLSHGHERVYYNPNDKKLLMTVQGTSSLYDWGVDSMLAIGQLKHTNRYKEAHQRLRDAKKKYGIPATIVGHSLGGAISGYISQSDDIVKTYNKGATIGQKIKNNETHYRTHGDVVSAFNSNDKNTINLKNAQNPNELNMGLNFLDHASQALHGLNKGSLKDVFYTGKEYVDEALGAHAVSNLKSEEIYV